MGIGNLYLEGAYEICICIAHCSVSHSRETHDSMLSLTRASKFVCLRSVEVSVLSRTARIGAFILRVHRLCSCVFASVSAMCGYGNFPAYPFLRGIFRDAWP